MFLSTDDGLIISGIEHFLKGKVPEHAKIFDLEKKHSEWKNNAPNDALAIHAVIVVFPQGSVGENRENEEWKHFRACMLDMIREGFNPVVVVTHMDQNKDLTYVSGLIYGCMDGWTDGWMDRWMDNLNCEKG